jgi:hypothetical protein
MNVHSLRWFSLVGGEGADVTHPTNRNGSEPSIAAVCASTNVYWTRFAADVKLLSPKVEIIDVRPLHV